MVVLTAAVIVVGVLCVLNLAVSGAVIRRLRAAPAPGGGVPSHGLAPGSAVPEVDLRDARGEPVTGESLRGHPTLVAFFATTCPECARHAPELTARAAALGAAGVHLLSALVDTGADREGLRPLLSSTGRLLVGEDAAELARRFRSDLTPAYFLVGADGRVVASGPALGALPLPLPIG